MEIHMKLDLYAKVILTIIAGCLLWICLRDITVRASANTQEGQPVVITGWRNMNSPIPIQINAISQAGPADFGGGKWDALKVSNDRFPLIVVEQKPTPTPIPSSPK